MADKFEEVLRLTIEAAGKGDVELLGKRLDELQAISAGASKEALALIEKLKSLSTTAGQIQAYTRLKGEIAETSTAIAQETEKLAQLRKELTETEKPTAALQGAIAKSEKALAGLLTTQNRQSVELQKTAGALTKAGVDTAHLAEASEKLRSSIGGTEQQLQGMAAQTGKSAEGMNKLEKSGEGVGKRLKEMAIRFTEIAIAAEAAHKAIEFGTDFLVESVHHAQELEDAINTAGAVTGATAEQMRELREAAEQAAHDTRYSSEEAAKALVELGRASGNAEQSIKSLPAALALARAAGIDTAAAATLLVQSLAEFGLNADQAGHVVDLLAKGAKTGGLELEGLAEELAKTAPLARQLGLDADQTVAIMAALAKEGFRGRLAASGLKDVFTQLADPTSKFREDLRLLGIQTTDFNQVVIELAKRGQDGRIALQDLSDSARPALKALVDDGGEKLRQMQAALGDVGGSATQAAAAMNNTLKGAFASLGTSWDELQENLLDDDAMKALAHLVRTIADEFDAFAKSEDFAALRQELSELFQDGAKAAEGLFKSIDFAGLAKSLREFVLDARGSIKAFNDNLAKIIGTVKLVYEAFRFAFDLIKAAILLLAEALAKLVQGVAKIGEELQKMANWDPTGLRHKLGLVNDESVGMWKSMGEGAKEAAAAVKIQLGDAMGGAVDALGELQQAGEQAFDGTGDAAAKTATKVKEVHKAANDAADGIDQAMERAAAKERKVAEEAAKVAEALGRLGIDLKSNQKALKDSADQAGKDFAVVVQQYRAGKLAIEDVRRAFEVYAQKVRASVADSDAWKRSQEETKLAVQAQLSGIGSAGKAAGDAVEDGARRGAQALRDEAAAAGAAAAGIKEGGDKADDADKELAHFRDTLQGTTFSLGAMSQAAADAFANVNMFATQGVDAWMKAFNRLSGELTSQQGEVKKLSDSLDEQLAKYDPLSDKIKALQQKFGYVAPEALRAIAEKQQRVEDEAKRQAEEQQRAKDEATRAAASASQQPGPSATAPSATTPAVGNNRAMSNPNLGAHATTSDSHHVIELKIPASDRFSDEDVAWLADRLGSLIEQRLATRTGRRF